MLVLIRFSTWLLGSHLVTLPRPPPLPNAPCRQERQAGGGTSARDEPCGEAERSLDILPVGGSAVSFERGSCNDDLIIYKCMFDDEACRRMGEDFSFKTSSWSISDFILVSLLASPLLHERSTTHLGLKHQVRHHLPPPEPLPCYRPLATCRRRRRLSCGRCIFEALDPAAEPH